MRLFGMDLDREVALVAEAGVNHEGDPEKALELVRLAADAGADAVKFQSYSPERFISRDDAVRRERVGRFGLDRATHEQLREEGEKAGIPVFSAAITDDVVPMLDALFPVIKIASADVTFAPTVRAAARTGKPLLLSTGMAEVAEIDRALDWIAEEIAPTHPRDRVVVMHCVSAYPTPIDQANLRAIPFLAARLGVTIGYSNHVIGPEAPLAAVALGARVVEVHFTDRKSGRAFRDHALSFEPEDLRGLRAGIDATNAALGRHGKAPMPCEAGREAHRKGLIAARDLDAGHVLEESDIAFARPGTEIDSNALPMVLGRVMIMPVKEGFTIPRDAVDWSSSAREPSTGDS